MKFIATLFSIAFIVSCANSKETNYTASTPADKIVRTFLGISLTDSIDFIRWKLTLTDIKYSLECNYGIGKPNTNGFYNNGAKVAFNGNVRKVNNGYELQNGKHVLKLAELNANLLHILDNDNTLLLGGAGWSYVLNNLKPSLTNHTNLIGKRTAVNDSISFEGRTPCGVPGIIEPGKQCYKLKWLIILYGNPAKNEPATYKVWGTPYRAAGVRRGHWKIVTRQDGRIIYQLIDEKGNPFIHLLKLDEGVLIFTDAKGNLLVGDLDFSYTLNRRF